MNEYLASVLNAERMMSFEEAQCPRSFCKHEYRDERPCGKPIPLRNV